MTRQHLIFKNLVFAGALMTGIYACSGKPSATTHTRDAPMEEIAEASVSSSFNAHKNIYNKDSLVAERYRDSLRHDSLRLDFAAELPKFPAITWEKLDFPAEPCSEWGKQYTELSSRELDHFSQYQYELFWTEEGEENYAPWYRLGKLPCPDGLTCLALFNDFSICGHSESIYVMIYDDQGRLKNDIRWQHQYHSAYEYSGESHASTTGLYRFKKTIVDYYVMTEDSSEIDSTIVSIHLENDGAVTYDTVFSQRSRR